MNENNTKRKLPNKKRRRLDLKNRNNYETPSSKVNPEKIKK